MKNSFSYGRTPWPEPRPKLRVGKWYLFKPLSVLQQEMKAEKKNKGEESFRGCVVGEYGRFYLIDSGAYRTTIHKASLGIDWKAVEL